MTPNASPRGHWAIYDRATGAVRTVARMSRRQAIQNCRPGERCIPCSASQYPAGSRVVGRKILVGAATQAAPSVAAVRQSAILDGWDVPQQLEAIVDALAGDLTKLDQLRAHLAAVKAAHPKA